MELRILSGLHRGAVLDLDEDAGALTLGSSSECDVLLADPGIAERHCRLVARGAHWRIEATGGRVVDRHGRAVTQTTAVGRGDKVQLAGVWIGIFRAEDPWEEATHVHSKPVRDPTTIRYPRAKAWFIVAVAAATLLPSAWFVSSAWGRAAAKDAGAPTTIQAAGIEPLATRPASPEKLAEEFTRALAERELKDRLELSLKPDRWEVRGSLEPDEQQRFERLLVRFIETRKPEFAIHVNLVAPSDLLPFKIVEVITGKGAGVVTDGGERLQVGDSHQGWRLAAVEPGKLVFVGRQRVEIPL